MAQRQASATRARQRADTSISPIAASGDAPTSRASRATGASAQPGVRIERLILHHLDHRANLCELVEEAATLDEAGERFFAGHVASAAERADWHARFRDGDEAVPTHLSALLGDAAQFVAASRALAERLYRYMRERSGNIAPGDFVAIAYRLGEEPARHVALLKMDPDQQRLTRHFTGQGKHLHVAISLASNLLPEAKSLQKCALISLDETTHAFSVRLLDSQAGPRSDGVAAFFYRDFLAATLTASARRQTRLFLAETTAWLNQAGVEFQPRDLLRFFAARRAALAGEYVALRDFAAAALPDRPDLAGALAQRLIASVLDDPDLRGAHPFFPVDRAAAKAYLEKV
ncbi:MAG: nucleoid-associated protein, partial [Chloroflexota bacterium]|nr:nucleoid-associated protein [Chloroflexota bacterium]